MDGRFRCSRATLHFPSSHLFLCRCFIYIYIYFLSLSLPYFPRELRVAFEIEDGFNKVLEIFIDSKNFSPIKGRFIRWKCRHLILSPIYPPIEPTRLASSTRYFHDLIFYSNFWRRLLRFSSNAELFHDYSPRVPDYFAFHAIHPPFSFLPIRYLDRPVNHRSSRYDTASSHSNYGKITVGARSLTED